MKENKKLWRPVNPLCANVVRSNRKQNGIFKQMYNTRYNQISQEIGNLIESFFFTKFTIMTSEVSLRENKIFQ